MKIAVLCGGLSPERNVSISSGTKIAGALKENGHQVVLLDMFFGLEDYTGDIARVFDDPPALGGTRIDESAPDLEAVRAQRKLQSPSLFGAHVLEVCAMADIVFLALHGRTGEDGRVQATLDLLGIPYTGSGYLGSAIAMDKDLTKRVVAPLGVKTPAWMLVESDDMDIDAVIAQAKLPCVVKPDDSGSSIGVSIANDATELRTALEAAAREGSRILIEQYVRGREVQIGILGDKALPSIEIIPAVGFYDYRNKYCQGDHPGGDPGRDRAASGRRRADGVPRPEPVGLFARRLHPRRRGRAVVPRDQHPARHDAHQPRAAGGRRRRYQLQRAVRADHRRRAA